MTGGPDGDERRRTEVSSDVRRTDVRGAELEHERRGSGPTLLWGHGLTSSRADERTPPALIDWDRAAESLDVIRYDARGHGRSGYTSDPAGYGWDALALDQLALADHLDLGRVVVGGASMGAGTALHVAVRAPERVAALVLVIPPTAWGNRREQVSSYERMAELIDGGRLDAVLAAGRLVAPPDPFVDLDGWHDRAAERLQAFEPARLAGLFRGAATADLPPPEAVAAIDVPALILAWTGDPGHPIATADRLAELLPLAEVHRASTRDEFATWTDRLLGFVAGLRAC
ncbi:MAG: alpha/beta hydrolase [Actinomycetota bacterium]